MSRRPPIKLEPGMIEQIYANIGVCYQCGALYAACKCDPTPVRLPRQDFPDTGWPHVTPQDYDTPDMKARAESESIQKWMEDNWNSIPEIPF